MSIENKTQLTAEQRQVGAAIEKLAADTAAAIKKQSKIWEKRPLISYIRTS